jgi:hypothetical protein
MQSEKGGSGGKPEAAPLGSASSVSFKKAGVGSAGLLLFHRARIQWRAIQRERDEKVPAING